MTTGRDLVAASLRDAHVSVVPADVSRTLVAAWRATFAARVHAQTGAFVYAGYDWHAFSWNFHPSIQGSEALVRYAALPLTERRTYVGSGQASVEFLFECAPCRPVFCDLRLDVLVFPDTLEWTIAFPHEVTMGPYFAVAVRAPPRTGIPRAD